MLAVIIRSLGVLFVCVLILVGLLESSRGQAPITADTSRDIRSEIKAATESEKVLYAASHARMEVEIAKDLCAKYGLPADRLEHRLNDGTRVDILADDYAYEVDWATNGKWAESIGQALYYGIMTDRKPGVILLVEDADRDAKYVHRCATVCGKYGIKLRVEILGANGKVRP